MIWGLFSLFSLFIIEIVTGNLITIQYYDDSSCLDYSYGVGITSGTCIQSSSVSINVTCSSSSGLAITQFSSTDCSGVGNTSVISNTIDVCSGSSTFLTNNFLQTPQGKYQIKCSDSSEWTNDGNYLITRTTTVLQASSAIDFTLEICPENNLITTMEYCFLNSNSNYCLPTDTDSSSGSSNSICLPSPVMYAYSQGCIPSSTLGKTYTYSTNNHELGLLTTYTNSGCGNIDDTYQLPFSECFGCNRFKDLANDNNGNSDGLAGGIIAAIVISVLFCLFFSLFFGAACCFGLATVTSGITAVLCCCCKQRTNQNINLTSTQASPLVQNQIQYPVVAQAAYAPPPPTAPPGYAMELISVQVPMDAKPGQILTVPKSNGQQVQFQLPPNVVPGSVIQVQG